MFFENNLNLRFEFIQLFNPKNIVPVRNTIELLKDCTDIRQNSLIGLNGKNCKIDKIIENIDVIIETLEGAKTDLSSHTVFYSWQSNKLPSTNRNFIKDCIEKAIERINLELPYSLVFDSDTRGTPGAPMINDAIFRKIDNAFCFMADITPVTVDGKQIFPNSNVMLETGYAFSSIGERRIILIDNVHWGEINQLPFDIKNRRIMTYSLSRNTPPEEKKRIKNELTNDIYNAIKLISNI